MEIRKRDVKAAKQALHDMIDRIEDHEVLNLYVKLLEREINWYGNEFFNTTDNDLMSRAESSLKSTEKGDTRNIQDFKKDVEKWKRNQTT